MTFAAPANRRRAAVMGRVRKSKRGLTWVRYRRFGVVAACPSEGPLTAAKAGFPRGWQGLLFMPHCRRSVSEAGRIEIRHSLDGRLVGSKQGHSAGLDDIFWLERVRRLRGRRSGGSQVRKIMVWKTQALCATFKPN